MSRLWAALRLARYALPKQVERIARGPGPAATARRCARLQRRGLAATVGYFQAHDATPDEIVRANRAVAKCLADHRSDVYLSVKAPPLDFDLDHLKTIATAAAPAGLSLLFDAHAPKDADRTLETVSALLMEFPRTGLALPARWRRSPVDAAHFRETSARIRLVKGEWPDPEADVDDVETSFLGLASRLAGRAAPVAVATHDPLLAQRALMTLLAAGTPCELEQLRGLPRRRTLAVARALDVPVRVYVPFGPGWWPYALDHALDRPWLAKWWVRDWMGSRAAPPAECVPEAAE